METQLESAECYYTKTAAEGNVRWVGEWGIDIAGFREEMGKLVNMNGVRAKCY